MTKDLQNIQIAKFALNAVFNDIDDAITDQLKRHLLDSIGSLIYATTSASIKKMAKQMEMIGPGNTCKVPVLKTLAYDRAAQWYTALIRYPDFMDNYLGKEATCHPSDNIGALFAASQFRQTSGADFLTAMAVAYQIECRLVEEIPVMKEGIDHTLLSAYSTVAGISKLLGLTEIQVAHALGIAGCSISPIVTSRASYTYEWKGFASSADAMECMNIVMLAQQGMTGPIALFEGPKGFKEVFDMNLDYDWEHENFELIKKCVLKKYNAEVHSQSAIEAALTLRENYSFDVDDIESIKVTTFLTAYHIIGSGAYGDRKTVKSKEQADHSMFYLIAAAILDGELYPEQFTPERINRNDVQELLQKVDVRTTVPLHKPVTVAGFLDPYTKAYPDKMKAQVEIVLKDGRELTVEKDDYPGFFTHPMSWDDVIKKFKRLCAGIIDHRKQQEIIQTVKGLEKHDDINDLLMLINDISIQPKVTDNKVAFL
jgi:2-methylcitrate dehydratase